MRPVPPGGALLTVGPGLARLDRGLAREGLVVPRSRERIGELRDAALEAPGPTPLADWLEPAPADFREKRLRELFARGAFDESRELHLTALALVRMLDRRDLIETHFPMLDHAAFLICRLRVLDEVARSLPPRAEAFARAWAKLSNEQKEALEWTYVHGEGPAEIGRVARKLRIDPDAMSAHAREGLRLLRLALRPSRQ